MGLIQSSDIIVFRDVTTGDSTNESRPEPVESPGLDIMPICSHESKWY
jgi:hypothetical protein